jgi:predicted DNA-binding transcriptional regulator AlpA
MGDVELVEALLIPDTAAAALAGIARSTLHALRAAGRWGPAPIRLGRALRFRRADVVAWIDAGCPDARTWEAMRAQGNGRR